MILKKKFTNNQLKYIIPYDKNVFIKNKFICLGFGLLYMVLFAVAGFINTVSSHTAWIIFPYIFLFLPIGINFLGIINLFMADILMSADEYQGSVIRIKNSTIAILALAILNILLDLVFTIRFISFVNIQKEIIYILVLVVLVASIFIFAKIYDKMFGGVTSSSNLIC